MKRLLARSNQKGFSLIKILVEFVVLIIVSLGIALVMRTNSHRAAQNRDIAFASQKVIQMMEELRAVSAAAGENGIGALDIYTDVSPNLILTTLQGVSTQGAPLSGNPDGYYARQIHVEPLANDPLARRVYVKVYRKKDMSPLAESMSVIYSGGKRFYATQVYDVYLLNIKNLGAGRMDGQAIYNMMNSTLMDLQARKPGLEIRTHRITRLSYGRDPYYTPNMNRSLASNAPGALPWVYLYPGRVQNGLWNDPTRQEARVQSDGVFFNGSPGVPPTPQQFSLADMFNHAVRYPDEVALYNAALADAQANNLPRPEPSWRMLLETMNQPMTAQDAPKNILLINLHGSFLPMPPLRNYSDAAKDWEVPGYAGVPPRLYQRVVTHPERLSYASHSTADVYLRVYAYLSNPSIAAPFDATIDDLTLRIANKQIAASDITVERLVGNLNTAYQWVAATSGGGTPDYDFVTTGIPAGTTVLRLHQTPLRHDFHVASRTGLPVASRLLGLEYIPCRTQTIASNSAADLAFQNGVDDLAHITPLAGLLPKNTARWRIRIARSALANTNSLAIETRLGAAADPAPGTTDPSNLSRTYVWVDQVPPFTERFQFIGDPRHLPYSDVKYDHGYNRYFRQLDPGFGYTGFMFSNGWINWTGATSMPGLEVSVALDVPRFMQILRGALLNSHSMFINVSATAFAMVFGGEVLTDGVTPHILSPWTGVPANATGTVDEISETAALNFERLVASVGGGWTSLPWLGELAPDSEYQVWKANGNLASADHSNAALTKFARRQMTSLPGGFPYQPGKYLNIRGGASLVNGSPSGSSGVFAHQRRTPASPPTGTLTAAGALLSNSLGLGLPQTISVDEPYQINDVTAGAEPVEWTDPIYQAQRTVTAELDEIYDSSVNAAKATAGIVQFVSGGNAGYLTPVGAWNSNVNMSVDAGKISAAMALRTYFDAGDPSVTVGRVPQLPYLIITSPALGAPPFRGVNSLSVDWTSTWMRWDSNPYTENYPIGHTEPGTHIYNAKFSSDAGNTWTFVNTTQSALPGVLDRARLVTAPFNWNISGFAPGTYILRLEAYRDAIGMHYAYQQQAIIVQP